MILDYNDYLEINNLLVELEKNIDSEELKEKIRQIVKILEKEID